MQEEMGLPQQEDVMLLGIVSRLADHKGLDLVKYIGEEMFQENLQLPLQKVCRRIVGVM